MTDFSKVVQRIETGDHKAAEELLPLVYTQLRRLAGAQMAQQPPGQTLQPTALVHEAWLKLTANGNGSWKDRKHFFCAAAEAMRQILIDRARRKKAAKHGGGLEPVDLDTVDIAAPAPDDKMIELNDALDRFAAEQPEKAEIVKLRFFVGLKEKEIADLLGITERTVQRYWAYAQVWLYDRLSNSSV